MDFKRKFTSRKFIAMLAGVAGGIVLMTTGNVLEGTAAVIASVVTYICAEAGIDKAAVKNTLEDVAERLEDETEDTEEEYNERMSADDLLL